MQVRTVTSKTIVLEVGGRLDYTNVNVFRDEMEEALTGPTPYVVLDFSSTQVIDSAGIGVILYYVRAFAEKRGQVVAAHLSRPATAVFQYTDLTESIECYASVGQALSALRTEE